MVAAIPGTHPPLHKKLTYRLTGEFTVSAAWVLEPSAIHRATAPIAHFQGQDKHRQTLPDTRSRPDKSTGHSRACTRAQDSPPGLPPIPWICAVAGSPTSSRPFPELRDKHPPGHGDCPRPPGFPPLHSMPATTIGRANARTNESWKEC